MKDSLKTADAFSVLFHLFATDTGEFCELLKIVRAVMPMSAPRYLYGSFRYAVYIAHEIILRWRRGNGKGVYSAGCVEVKRRSKLPQMAEYPQVVIEMEETIWQN